MRICVIFLFIYFLSMDKINAQFLIPGEGLMDVKIGADWDEVEWELGFRGEKIDKENTIPELLLIAEKANVDFDFVVQYHHIMRLPITDLFFKDDKICMIQISSYPEFNNMICADIGTTEGLNFWDDMQRVKDLYGNNMELKQEGKSYIVFKDRGLGVELSDNEVRTMFIFPAQMK